MKCEIKYFEISFQKIRKFQKLSEIFNEISCEKYEPQKRTKDFRITATWINLTRTNFTKVWMSYFTRHLEYLWYAIQKVGAFPSMCMYLTG